MNTPLYELAQEYKAAFDQMQELGIDETTIEDTLDGMSGDLTTKCINTMKYALRLEDEAIAAKTHIDRMTAAYKAKYNLSDKLKDYVKTNMIVAGIKSVPSDFFTLSIQGSGSSVIIDDESLLPITYLVTKTTITPDKRAIKDALKLGDVAGVHLEYGFSLRVK